MTASLLVATLLGLTTVAIHYIGITVLSRFLKVEARAERLAGMGPLSLRGAALGLGVVGALFVLHAVEIWLYAGFYAAVGAVKDFDTALYFSTITYSTIGYDDEHIAASWRMVAAIEGINGVIMLGWSTAFLVTLVGRLGRGQPRPAQDADAGEDG